MADIPRDLKTSEMHKEESKEGSSQGRSEHQGQPPVIDLENVSLQYSTKAGVVEALSGVSMNVSRNEFLSVIGPSGCGKTTLLKIISKVLRVSSGSVRINGTPLDKVDLTGELSYVFQRPLLLPWRSALKNVLLPLELVHGGLKEEHIDRAKRMLDLTGLASFEDMAPHHLSGGMQQRVSLARALALEPKILLMDEPLAALDEITRESMQGELLRIWYQTRNTILFITHNIEEAVLLSDRVVVLSSRPGTVVKTLTVDLPRPRSEDIREAPEFRKLVKELRSLLRIPGGESVQ